MDIYRLVFSDDPAQALRIKRCLSANKAYLIVALLAYYAMHFNYLPGFSPWFFLFTPLTANLIFYSLLRSGTNLYFEDPSLTVPQTVYAIFGYMLLLYYAFEVRGAFMALLLIVPMSITLRVRPKQLFWVMLLPLITMACIIIYQQINAIDPREFVVASLEWLALATGAVWLSLDAGYMARKRREAKDSTLRLENALIENISLVENLTHEKKLAEAANLSNLAKSKRVAAANHDLRQPLHALNLFVAQLHSQTDCESRERILTKIDACLLSINELFDSLMDISRLNTDVNDPQIQDCRLQDIFNRVENTFRETAEQKGLQLIFRKTNAIVKSDPLLLERILLNLVNNALRYTPAGKVLIAGRKRGSQIELQVWDTGIGIKPDDQQKIFEEFFQVNKNANQNTGSGLGLAIVKKLCELLNHRIRLTSTLNKGSCFSVLLDNSEASGEITDYPSPTDNNLFRHKIILILDDDLMVLQAMEGFISAWGCNVITALSIDEATKKIKKLSLVPDLIISDYSLAESTTGLDAINTIHREWNKKIPAFLMTANTDKEKINEVHNEGFTLLSKPVQPMLIKSLVAQYLSH